MPVFGFMFSLFNTNSLIFSDSVVAYVCTFPSLQGLETDVSVAAFHTQRPGNQSICLLGQKILATIFVMRTQAENLIKCPEVKRQMTDHGQTELSNMLVTKNVLNEMNKEVTFTQGFKDCSKIKRKVSQNFENFQNLLIKLTAKTSSEKLWLLYEFPF